MTPHIPDWSRLVSIDLETYYDQDYTLKKLSTSEYVRDPRFKAQMMGIRIGNGKTRTVPHAKIPAELAKINWATHSLLCHNTAFDGLILSHHYGVVPAYYYDTLSMARGLHSNEIGAGLDEVSIHYGGAGKLDGLDQTQGVVNWSKKLFAAIAPYCANDVDEMIRVFRLMLPQMPSDEMDLINLTCRMFCDPVLRVDIPRVEAELKRELDRREELLTSIVDLDEYDMMKLLKGKERNLEPKERDMLMVKRIIGSAERFADLLRAEGIDPPVKISPAWMKLPKAERESEEGLEKKYTYAFAKDDHKFTDLPNRTEDWGFDLNNPEHVEAMVLKQERVQALVDCRIIVKSTTNVTRAERFLKAGADGLPLPVGYAYYRAHCLTGDAEVLTRTGWMRLDIWKGGDIAQWAENGAVVFAEAIPNAFGIAEPMVTANSRYHNARYTLGHTIPGFTSCGTFAPRQAGNAAASRFMFPISGTQDGDALITVLDAQIAVMVQADGNIRTDTRSGRCIRFGFKKHRKIVRCMALLTEAQIPYSQRVSTSGVTTIYIGASDMHLALKLLDETTKRFLPVILNAPLKVKHAFIDELTHWDGDVEPHRKGFTYSTTDRPNAEMVQTLAHLTGQSAYVSERSRKRNWATSYRVHVRSDSMTRSEPKHYSTQWFSGEVFCPTTQTGFFLMRQNGKIVVTGNTGRFGGTNKMNFQNLPRGGELRLSILAPKGHMIAVADSGQIEARVNAWLWGQNDLIDGFRAADAGTGRDAYCNFADHIYGRVITKENDPVERQVGKVAVLGLGYQMGAAKFQTTLAKSKIYFELDRCKEIVTTYREVNHRIAAGWRFCDRIINDMFAGRAGHHGPISWEKETIFLPNGMKLKYPDLKKTLGENDYPEWTYQSKDSRKKMYGGLLTENIVQALARIIVMWQMLQIDKKYCVVMTTHDEVACIVKKAQAQKCMDYLSQCMRTPPDWCLDLPLNSEGKVDVNYSK